MNERRYAKPKRRGRRGKRGRRGLREVGHAPRDHGGRCAVIVSAWDAARWIGSMIRSYEAQLPREGWTYELRIGVDGCEETSARLLELGRAHWFSPQNVGPYIVRNSLIALEPADAYAIFDADDMMLPEFLRETLRFVGRDGIVGPARKTISEEGRIISRHMPYGCGIAVFAHGAWEQLGGYRPWRIAADYDLVLRARALRVRLRETRHAYYLRRRHLTSLTRHPDTRIGSPLRNELKERAESLAKLGLDLHVRAVTTPLEWREP